MLSTEKTGFELFLERAIAVCRNLGELVVLNAAFLGASIATSRRAGAASETAYLWMFYLITMIAMTGYCCLVALEIMDGLRKRSRTKFDSVIAIVAGAFWAIGLGRATFSATEALLLTLAPQ